MNDYIRSKHVEQTKKKLWNKNWLYELCISLVINTLQYDARYIQRHINTLQYDARYT